jgi:hypothetical protein
LLIEPWEGAFRPLPFRALAARYSEHTMTFPDCSTTEKTKRMCTVYEKNTSP